MAAPIIDNDIALPSTPAKEWADKTTSSLSAGSIGPAEMNANDFSALKAPGVTPGPDIPGAYPPGPDVQGPFVMGDPRSAAMGIYNTAKSYIPAQGDVEKAILNVGGAAKHYLPGSVVSYFPSQTGSDAQSGSLNTNTLQENENSLTGQNAAPDSGIPGRIDTSFLTPHTNAGAQNGNGGSDSTSNISTRAQDGSEVGARSSLDTPTGTPSPYQTGTLNGRPTTSGDTLQPQPKRNGEAVETSTKSDNRHKLVKEPVLNTNPRTHPLGKDGAKWKGVPLSEGYQSELDANSERQLNIGARGDHTTLQPQDFREMSEPGKVKDDSSAIKDKVARNTVGQTDSGTRPDNLNQNADSARADAGHSPAERHVRGVTGKTVGMTGGTKASNTISNLGSSSKEIGTGSGNSPHRSKFMDRIKGEVKVISGKLAHNESKVEEGKRLMGKVI